MARKASNFDPVSGEPLSTIQDSDIVPIIRPGKNLRASALDLKNYVGFAESHFRGRFTSLAALKTALPTAEIGDYAQVDEGPSFDVINYNWDAEDGWVQGGSGSSATTTDELPEGATNKYFTASRVLAVALTGLTDVADALLPTDTILAAFGKIKKTISDYLSSFNAANKLLKIDSDGKLPALDGSKLTGISAGAQDNYAVATGTNNYAATITGIAALTEGMSVRLKFTNANTGNSTLNINSLGAKTIYRQGTVQLLSGAIQAGMVMELYYDGAAWQFNGPTVVPTGINKAVTTNGNGVMETVYDVKDMWSATSTTASALEAADWSTGEVLMLGVAPELRQKNGWLYVCIDTDKWWRTPFNMQFEDFIYGATTVNKTNADMIADFPDAPQGSVITSPGGMYMNMGVAAGWMFFENKIAI